ncbi:d-3-phosphoglycerate dehydrogenase-like protein [Xylogone sp. PMI_703]|nr:d-3-phosphoglycerate dehydrogenase-like protein [Xylogone sp. PMI_703]
MAPSAEPQVLGNSASIQANLYKILIPEKVSPDGLALLSDKFEIHQPKNISAEQLQETIPQYHALIIRSETKVTAGILAAARNLKVVARAGVGVDNIDVDAATNHGIIVVNSPSGNIAAAAEHTIALLMSVARNVPAGDRSLRAGGWERSKLVGTEVGGKTLGVVGLGKVGLKVARMAIGLGMKVLALDPYASPEIARTNSVNLVADLPSLLKVSDFLTIHTPLIASTMDLISKKELTQMKPTAKILNVARGGVINESALLAALDAGTIAGAGLDVFTQEPPTPGSTAEALTRHPKVVVTPHLGASTVEAQENVSKDVCAQVLSVLTGGLPTSAVNAPLILPEEYKKLQPFVLLIEKMGSIFTQHYGSRTGARGGTIGGRRFNLVYEGELASISNTRPLFAALIKGLTGAISERRGRDVNIVNAELIAKEKGIVVNETHNRESNDRMYANQVSLKASPVTTTEGSGQSEHGHSGGDDEQIISGYVSGKAVYISRLDRFTTSFVPEGTLLALRNYDEPGKIGSVGSILGVHGVNIKFMTVAALEKGRNGYGDGDGGRYSVNGDKGDNEALMILGVDGDITGQIEAELRDAKGILDVSVIRL